MRIRGVKWLRQVSRRLESRFVDGALILLYHGIVDRENAVGPQLDPYGLRVSSRHFVEQMEVLQSETRVLSLQELVRALQERCVPRDSVVVTFDDGYADNLYCAYPVLLRLGIPATVFVAAGPASVVREFWWDELTRLICLSARPLESLSLVIGEQVHTLRGRNGNALLRLVYRRLRPLRDRDRAHVLAQLRSSIQMGTSDAPVSRTMSSEEIAELAGSGLVQVGGHTVDHSVLANLSPLEQRNAISENKDWLEEVTGRPIETFAYPYGLPSDYTRESAELVRELGFVCACTGSSGVAWRGSDLYRLPRLWVRDWDGERFARWLHKWLGT
jgi:peptidoglycan/xylan/chitin deacetylase (PgdA/CDA1 family)